MKKESDRKNDYVKLIKNKNELFHLIYEFNMAPTSYAHMSWIAPIISNHWFTRLSKSKRGLKKLSKLILQHHNLDQDFYYNFYEKKYRLALLPCDVLKKLTFYGGLALWHKEIKTCISKNRKVKIVEKIGDSAYRFATVSSPLLVGNLMPKPDTIIQSDDPKRFLQECGSAFLLFAYKNEQNSFYKRLLLKFPKDINIDLVDNFLEFGIDPSIILTFFLRIMKHVIDTRWQQFIC
ncbi:type III secretion system cytoplasmic protein, YscK [Desulfosarcina variabilis str. Montpellier]|uniref:SctK family type III secretion system sorting platform protein n=1 Tax=Desulfosarcina variabilis TaxID=2300 RepID=UPI003AFAA7DA